MFFVPFEFHIKSLQPVRQADKVVGLFGVIVACHIGQALFSKSFNEVKLLKTKFKLDLATSRFTLDNDCFCNFKLIALKTSVYEEGV